MSHHLIVYIVYKYNNTLKDKIKAYFQQKIDILYFTNYKTREHYSYKDLYEIFDNAYKSLIPDELWYNEEIVQKFL